MKYYPQLIIRLFLILVSVPIISFILTPLTIYTSYFILNYYNPILIGNILDVNGIRFEFVEACIAIYAYYFLLLLVLLTKNINLKVRSRLVIYGFLAIFAMNIFRIWLVVFLALEHGFYWFNLVHLLFWKFLMGAYVAIVWILLVRNYKIKSIPVYDDLKTVYKDITNKKSRLQ
ncbi:pacearchaeosortase [Candidatus Woesearchaeota archaeon]|nr:pacearchaeosortase [Candidatus Woesearchaeota archaeon]